MAQGKGSGKGPSGRGPTGKGPTGQGPGSGRGMGTGGGRGRMGGFGGGPGGNCVCPDCGTTAPHQRGTPCVQMQCPKCGAAMTRET